MILIFRVRLPVDQTVAKLNKGVKMAIEISIHASKRIRERMGINKKAVTRLVENAEKNGLYHKDAKGKLKKWMDKEYLKYNNVHKLFIFNNMLFLVTHNILITVFSVPNNLLKYIK